MEANIDRNITLDSVASLVKLSPRHFRRVFRASTGVGPSQMFTNIRLDQAARDLRYSRGKLLRPGELSERVLGDEFVPDDT